MESSKDFKSTHTQGANESAFSRHGYYGFFSVSISMSIGIPRQNLASEFAKSPDTQIIFPGTMPRLPIDDNKLQHVTGTSTILRNSEVRSL